MTDPKILIVEDEQAICDTLVEVLEINGYSVLTANNGKEALQVLERNPPPCIILLDLMMPVMGGMDFLEYIDKLDKYKHIPILILSAFNYTEHKYKNVVGFLKKPMKLDALMHIIEEHCGQR